MDATELPYNKDLTYLGQTTFRDQNKLFGIKRKDRRQHVYILGKSGTGKSVLMFNMIIQNIKNGDGVCLVDPHGENVEAVLSAIPQHRLKDVVYFNPADTEYHIGFNVLELPDPKYKHLVASGLMGIFTKIWANAWSARMEYILNNAILALLDTPGTTMLGIPRMLVDKDYRQKIISNLKDPVIKAFWVHEYEEWQDKFRNEAIAPIQNKVGQFLSTSIIRNIVGQSKSTINIFDLMNQGKIFLVNVSKGRIGEDNSALLGGMIITKIQLAAMERVRIPEEERKDFYLYVDEFQNFVTDAFAGILSEARKYRLNLTVAHQYTAQLVTKESSSVRDAIFGNIGTMIVFRVGADDAEFLEKEFEPEFTPEDIVNLPNYKIYIKLMIDGVTSRPFSARTLPPMVKIGENPEAEAEVIRKSRELYCRPRDTVEKEINDWSGMSLGEDDASSSGSTTGVEKFDAVCSICGQPTKVPFRPEPGRPIYCRDCIAKIKAGELKPLSGSSNTGSGRDEGRFFKPLADLGIEFKEEPSSVPNNGKKTNGFSSLKAVFKKNQNGKKFQQKKEEPPAKKERDTSALREILNKTLNDNIPPVPKEEKIQSEERPKDPGPEPISLESLKEEKHSAEAEKPKKEDRAASAEDMNKLKDLIFEAMPEKKEEEPAKDVLEPVSPAEPDMSEPEPEPESEPEQEPQPEQKDEPIQSDPGSESTPENDIETISTSGKNEIPVPPYSKKVKEVPEDILRKMLDS